MFHSKHILLACAGSALALAVLARPAHADNPVPPTAKQLIADNCMACHDSSMFTARPIGKGEWAGILQRMVGYKADLAKLDLKVIETYLAAAYPAQTNGG